MTLWKNSELEKTIVYNGSEDTTRAITQFIANTKRELDICADSIWPSVAVSVEPIAKQVRKRKKENTIKLRIITDINKENLEQCKRIREYATEFRHLEGIKGNFGINETEYVAATILKKDQPIPQVIYSSIHGIVEQQKYLFDTLWNKAVPADVRIKELEEGVTPLETQIIKDEQTIISKIRDQIESSTELSFSSNYGFMQLIYKNFFGSCEKILQMQREGGHKGIRWLTSISKDTIPLVRLFLEKGIQVRHSKTVIPLSFMVSEKSFHATIENMEGGRMIQNMLASNDRLYVEHFQSMFTEFWKNSADAETRIRDIEEGVDSDVEVIRNPQEAQKRYVRLVNSVRNEVTLLLPSATAFTREKKFGILEALKNAALRGVKVRILTPVDEQLDQEIEREEFQKQGINLRRIEKLPKEVTVKFLTVDRRAALVMELKDDSKEEFVEAVGLVIYSANKSIVYSYVSAFETLWGESELRDREAKSKRQSQLLQDILAHDIRNYNQASRLSAEILREELRDNEDVQKITQTLLQAIDGSTQLVERAKKLGRILSDYSPSLHPVDVTKSIQGSLALVRQAYPEKNIIIVSEQEAEPKHKEGLAAPVANGAKAIADDFLDEVFVNVFSNSVKYTEGVDVPIQILIEEDLGNGSERRRGEEEGGGSVRSIKEATSSTLISSEPNPGNTSTAVADTDTASNSHPRFLHVIIVDRGKGIPDEMKNNIFDRYLQSAKGSGLGMSIVHALVVERYHGEVKVENRVEGDYSKGTKVHIWLPKAASTSAGINAPSSSSQYK